MDGSIDGFRKGFQRLEVEDDSINWSFGIVLH